MDNERKFALLIDADNISPKYLMVMLAEAKDMEMLPLEEFMVIGRIIAKNMER